MRLLYRRFSKPFLYARRILKVLHIYDFYLTFNNWYFLRPINSIRFPRVSAKEFDSQVIFKRAYLNFTKVEKQFLKYSLDSLPSFIKKYLSRGFYQPEIFVSQITDVTLHSDSGLLFTKEGKVVTESLHHELHLDRIEKYETPKKSKFLGANKTYAVLHHNNLMSSNYFHMHIDILPKLTILKGLKKDITILLPKNSSKILLAEVTKITSKSPYLDFKIIENAKYQIKNYLFISPLTLPFSGILPKELLPSIKSKGYDLIYIKRPTRGLYNEDEVANLVESEGVKIVVAEDYTYEEQKKLFSKAKVIISAHGAGLTNMMFAPKGCKILEILPNDVPMPYFMLLSKSLGHKYDYIYGSYIRRDNKYKVDLNYLNKKVMDLSA